LRESTRTCEPTRATWDEHWNAIRPASSLFGRIASLVRTQVISRAVAYYASRYLTGDGPLVEAGCGTGQSSWRIDVAGHPRIALDYASGALREARAVSVFDAFLQGDITHLPLRDASIAGLWNLGVLEHFDEAAGIRILREFRRVLAPGAHAVLFWPPEFGSSRMVLAPIEKLRSFTSGSPFRFFPDEVNRLASLAHARRLLAAAGLEERRIDFSPRDLFIYVVVVARRPS
jgi:ubiquinone/menaquinone biosynthesis C-methylase UbiE